MTPAARSRRDKMRNYCFLLRHLRRNPYDQMLADEVRDYSVDLAPRSRFRVIRGRGFAKPTKARTARQMATKRYWRPHRGYVQPHMIITSEPTPLVEEPLYTIDLLEPVR